jgi:predicted membrane protein
MTYGFYGIGFSALVFMIQLSFLMPLIFYGLIFLLLGALTLVTEKRNLLKERSSSFVPVSLGTASIGVVIGYLILNIVIAKSSQFNMLLMLIAFTLVLGAVAQAAAFRVVIRYGLIKKYFKVY